METRSAPATKAELRTRYRQWRRDYANGETSRAVQAHCERWLADYGRSGTQVCLFRPMAEEPQIAFEPMTDFFYPRIEGENLKFLKPRSMAAFQKGALGILEPAPQASDALNSQIPMMVFCPAVAVDRQGRRLGMGKGFYDRFFSNYPEALRIGVVYQIQVSESELPAESWDQTLDWIVTDKMILRTSNRSVQ